MAETTQPPADLKYERIDTYKEWQANAKDSRGHAAFSSRI